MKTNLLNSSYENKCGEICLEGHCGICIVVDNVSLGSYSRKCFCASRLLKAGNICPSQFGYWDQFLSAASENFAGSLPPCMARANRCRMSTLLPVMRKKILLRIGEKTALRYIDLAAIMRQRVAHERT